MSATDQEESIIQYYLKAASIDKKSNSKSEPNGRAMFKAMEMFNGHGRGAELLSAKDTAYGLLCSITEFVDHERRLMSRDHRLNSAWFGMGATIKQRGLEQALYLLN